MSRRIPSPEKKAQIRCAIYTRKSTEEGLELEFNSLDAQRESAEAFIKSQAHEGWVCVPEKYDDGGFSGGNMERPALRQLLADIDAGKIDCVVVYKVDRLSRSLLDFTRIMETFDRRGASFVSVTQQFNTTHSMGRLTLNILLSFAQFEREIISERIRDKIAAQRRKGKWCGGRPVLGYDVDRSGPSPKLVINSTEATKVRQIFSLYLQHAALLPVVRELRKRDWKNKMWQTRKGDCLGGLPFDKCSLYQLLTNPVYAGRIRHKDKVFDGEHEALIASDVWDRVQQQLGKNGRDGGVQVRNRHGALLKGLLRCKGCGRTMSHTFSETRGKRYRYYTCTRAVKEGYDRCQSPSLPAAEIERVVVEQIRGIAEDRGLREEVLKHIGWLKSEELADHDTQRRQTADELRRCEAEIRRLAAEPHGRRKTDRLAELNERVQLLETRLRGVGQCGEEPVEAADVATVFDDIDAVWSSLSPREQAELVALLVAEVDYDAAEGTIAVSFHETGIRNEKGSEQ